MVTLRPFPVFGTSTRRRLGPGWPVTQILSEGSLRHANISWRKDSQIFFPIFFPDFCWEGFFFQIFVEKDFLSQIFSMAFFRKEVHLHRFTTTSKILKKLQCFIPCFIPYYLSVTFTCSPPRSCSSNAFTANWKCSISKATSGVKGLASASHLNSPVHCLVSISLEKPSKAAIWALETKKRFGICQDNQHILEIKNSWNPAVGRACWFKPYESWNMFALTGSSLSHPSTYSMLFGWKFSINGSLQSSRRPVSQLVGWNRQFSIKMAVLAAM